MTPDKTEAQPEALRLADALHSESDRQSTGVKYSTAKKSAAELRRQQAEIQQLKAQPSARQAAPDGQWKCANEYLPYHPDASHVHPAYRDGWNDCYRAGTPPPEREPLTDLQKQALAVYLPPFQFSHGYVFDSAGRMVADEGREHELDQLASTVGMRIRGWGHLGKLKNGAEVQDTIGELAAEALNAFWKQHGIGATNAR